MLLVYHTENPIEGVYHLNGVTWSAPQLYHLNYT